MKETEFPKDWQEALAILVEGNDRSVKGEQLD